MSHQTGKGVDAIGIAWLRKEDYAALVALFEDADAFDSWEQWNERAKATEKKLKSEGFTVLRAYLDPKTFPTWCALRGIKPGRDARTRFGAEFAQEHCRRSQN